MKPDSTSNSVKASLSPIKISADSEDTEKPKEIDPNDPKEIKKLQSFMGSSEG